MDTVNVFLGALARNSQYVMLVALIDAEHQIGEPAESRDFEVAVLTVSKEVEVLENPPRLGQALIIHGHALT